LAGEVIRSILSVESAKFHPQRQEAGDVMLGPVRSIASFVERHLIGVFNGSRFRNEIVPRSGNSVSR
jgi:hypothetical protein